MQLGYRRLGAHLAAAAAAAGRCQAAWSCEAALKAAVAAQQRGGSHRAAQPRDPRVFGGSGGAARLSILRHLLTDCAGKSARASTRVSPVCVRVRGVRVRD